MPNYTVKLIIKPQSKNAPRSALFGQALVEYALILTLAIIGLVVVFALTQDEIRNVFNEVIADAVEQPDELRPTSEATSFWNQVTYVASYTPDAPQPVTNTPPAQGAGGVPPPDPCTVDTDGDGWFDCYEENGCEVYPDGNDASPPDPGYPTGDGCPADTDSDGLHDGIDACPYQGDAGYGTDADGCPNPTPGPSITPTDAAFGYPFTDAASSASRWQTLFTGLLGNNWDIKYWDYSGSGAGQCNSGNIFTGNPDPATAPRATDSEEFYVIRVNLSSGQQPFSGVNENYCAQYKSTVNIGTGTYVWRYRKNDGVRIYVNGTLVIDDWNWDPNRDRWQTVEWVNTTAEDKNIIVLHRDGGNTARLNVELHRKGLYNQYDDSNNQTANLIHAEDDGDGTTQSPDKCNWQLNTAYVRSATTAWDDSPGSNYSSKTICVLRLRGTVDLTSATNPVLTFFNALDISNGSSGYDRARIGISEAYTNDWNYVTVHTFDTNKAMQREVFDLTDFGGIDYAGKLIEVQFLLEADSSNQLQGWFIDDVYIGEDSDRVYTVPVFDDVEDDVVSRDSWIANGSWTRTDSNPYDGIFAWTDSPLGNYSNATNSSLDLNGRLDLSTPGLYQPQVAFWHRYFLNADDAIYVELSLDRRTWYALPKDKKSFPEPEDLSEGDLWLARSTDSPSYQQTVLQIPDRFIGESHVYLRFRLDARYNSSTDQGWWIDNIEVRNKPTYGISPNWCDSMETGSSEWIIGGTWAITNEHYYDGGLAWSDSPNSNYTNPSENILELRPNLNLIQPTTPTLDNPTLVRPVLEFWHRYELADTDHLYVEIQEDGASDWDVIWSYLYNNARPQGYGSTTRSDNYNDMVTWTREVIELSPYLNQGNMRVRFRLDARVNGSTDDGWFIDKICFIEATTPVAGIPFADDFEGGNSNWILGGEWEIQNERTHTGSFALIESPNRDYRHESNSIAELKPTIYVAPVLVEPTLYFWEQYELGRWDYTNVEVRRVDSTGKSIGDWERLKVVDGCAGDCYYSRGGDYSINEGWNRVQLDLRPYIGEYIRIRWRQQALSDSARERGWYIDNVSIVERHNAERVYDPNPAYFEDIETLAPGEWVFEHEWDQIADFREDAQSTTVGPGQWDVRWYDNVTNGCKSFALLDQEVAIGTAYELDFNWGNGRPAIPALTSNDTFGALFTRTVFFESDTTYRFTGRVDDGVRIYTTLNGITTKIYDSWYCQDSTFTSSPYTFAAGTHFISVEYYEQGGGARLTLNFEEVGQIGSGQWNVQWYDNATNKCTINQQLTEPRGSGVVNKLDFNWGTGSPSGAGLTSPDTWGARFIQEMYFVEERSFTFNGRANNVVRIYDGSTLLYDSIAARGGCWNGSATFTTPVLTFSAGPHTIMVEFFEDGGDAELYVQVGAQSLVFHDSPGAYYRHNTNASVMMEGYIDLTGFGAGSYPGLIWEQKYRVERYDFLVVEVSTDEGFTWQKIWEKPGPQNDDVWKEAVADLSPYNGETVVVRFRVESMSDGATNDGWWIDNIRVLE